VSRARIHVIFSILQGMAYKRREIW